MPIRDGPVDIGGGVRLFLFHGNFLYFVVVQEFFSLAAQIFLLPLLLCTDYFFFLKALLIFFLIPLHLKYLMVCPLYISFSA